jgi:hypothetical protein
MTLRFPSEPSDPVTMYLYLVTDWTGTPTNRQLEEHSTKGWYDLGILMT